MQWVALCKSRYNEKFTGDFYGLWSGMGTLTKADQTDTQNQVQVFSFFVKTDADKSFNPIADSNDCVTDDMQQIMYST